MRKVLGLIVLLAATATIGAAKDDKKAPPKLDGTYLIVAIEDRGEKVPDAEVTKRPEARRTIVIKGDVLISNKDPKEETLAIKLDSSKNPAEIDVTEKSGDKPVTTYGIYKLEGDTLTICIREFGKVTDRPKEFKTTKDSKTVMLTLKKK